MPVLSAAKPQCMLIFSAQPRETVVAKVRRIAETRILMLLKLVFWTLKVEVGILQRWRSGKVQKLREDLLSYLYVYLKDPGKSIRGRQGEVGVSECWNALLYCLAG